MTTCCRIAAECSSRAPLIGVTLLVAAWLYLPAAAQGPAASPGPVVRCTAIELYLVGDDAQRAADAAFVTNLFAQRGGLSLRQYDVTNEAKAQSRHAAIAQHFQLDPAQAGQHALFYAANRYVQINERTEAVAAQLQELLRFEFFGRAGCPRCAKAEPWVKTLVARYPGFEFQFHEVLGEPAAGQRVAQLAKRYRTPAASYPVLHVCGQLLIGWDSERSSGKRVETLLDRWTAPCKAQNARQTDRRSTGPARRPFSLGRGTSARRVPGRLVAWQQAELDDSAQVDTATTAADPNIDAAEGEAELPIGELPLPEQGDAGDLPAAPTEAADMIDLPLLGSVRASEVGMPVFTLAVGLIDGFNPCAMWVLLFLLSVLVNLHSRIRMLAVAGTFVVISGVAYFAFIAAWLNVLQWVGLLRPVQIALALLAIFIGAVHVKDFFAFHRGLSLSIPESAKPGIYARVRRIVMAESLWAAIAGACVLAVLVNFIELLCTAGLPCMYSQILTMQSLPAWQNYLYLLLYIVAYMFDDSLMVAGVVVTLGRPKMQEVHGRWLKLVSGAVIFVLGFVMLVRPQWLT
ncbi:MAG: hypothetical protein K1X74_05180 [Pirellulales bacterium]|nr:hypothetical protein [Pirellulales bacterium]